MVDKCPIAEWHSVTGTILLPDEMSGNQMPRLRDYIYIVPTIRLLDEMSGNWMPRLRDYIYIDIYGMVIRHLWFGYRTFRPVTSQPFCYQTKCPVTEWFGYQTSKGPVTKWFR